MAKTEIYDFKKLYETIRKVEKDQKVLPAIINYKEFESWFSLLLSLTFGIILWLFTNTNDNNIAFIVSSSQNMLLYLISGLIAMLGFIVAGLAIMISTTSKAIMNKLINEGKFEYLISVFASFVFISVVMVLLIICCMALYFVLGINYPFINWLYSVIAFFLSYLVFFTLFYVVSLLGTCINIFIFNYDMSVKED
ncbi:hypothetical protein [Lysinibacillus sp. 3P01SB]|uniref:hypothetical protein n=1 Tax=Lysinibacillus sp. 3P01SB TaxID=3132284 RepID=UPI0039A482D9